MFKAGSQHRQKETPPSPTYMKDDQFAAYLADLRSSRQARPAGARELPADPRRSRVQTSVGSSTSGLATDSSSSASASSGNTIPDQVSLAQSRQTAATDVSTLNGSIRSRYSTSSQAKDYYPTKPVLPLKPSEVVPSDTYIERGSRWMEKEEAHSLRQAMEVLDMRDAQKKQASFSSSSSPPTHSTAAMGHGSIAASIPPQNAEEERIYNAALNEASELVWQHQNGVAPPNPNSPYAYRPHMRKNSYAHARTAAAGLYGDDIAPSGLARDRSQSISEGSSDGDPGSRTSRFSIDSSRQSGSVRGADETCSSSTDVSGHAGSSSTATATAAAAGSSYSGMSSGKYAPPPRRRSSMKRNISGEIDRPFSGEQIWEEPESRHNSPAQRVPYASPPSTNPPATTTTTTIAAAAAATTGSADVHPTVASSSSSSSSSSFSAAAAAATTDPRSSNSTPLNSRPLPKPIKPYERSENEPLSRVEIHRNPPTQSRNPIYTRSDSTASTSSKKVVEQSEVPRKNGVEIRSDDVRNATRIRLNKDRKIPTPTAVSDNPGRPIVSFDANWTPPDESTDKRLGNGRTSPPSSSSFVTAIPDATASTQAGSLRSRSASPTKHTSSPVDSPVSGGGGKAGFSSHSPFSARGRGVGRFAPPAASPQSPAEAVPPSSWKGAPMAPPSIAVSRDSSSSKTQSNVNSNVPSISVQAPSISVQAPSIPSISVPDVPSISVSGGGDSASPAAPSIVVSGNDSSSSTSNTPTTTRPLPTPSGAGETRSLPHHPRHHWSPAPGSVRRGMTVCHECGLTIEGRFVSLAGSREKFHPSCFACYTCGTNLEALEISPEPETARAERLERIRLRNSGQHVPDEPGKTAIDDGDERLRFYCHLDWHEQFAPRCKHCKTPILGEHIVALGNHWHYGHFFCAECGDPFEHGMTHIEKDGYAWCVRCQTRRTERRAPKCKKCKAAVIGQYVQALGGEWHETCFRCATCDGGFDDGQIFPVERGGGTVVLCTQCRMRELKR
ncbi:hypothetical protein TD95_001913 [Thielaviopsis punctulata]|uniref:LIM zinc-binding domain-containing protein n=1 Tax=Thielaviopsis punctulata TaxID=72032 RepID=A0A0F4ZK38_9PEZI|nr:hypothetical protein TD95_001913 [Thielaviopsis punctulata]